jgi:hypothetical protein
VFLVFYETLTIPVSEVFNCDLNKNMNRKQKFRNVIITEYFACQYQKAGTVEHIRFPKKTRRL